MEQHRLHHHLPQTATVSQRFNRHFHKVVFYVVPLVLTFRLVSFNGKHWQPQMTTELLLRDCNNCSCPSQSTPTKRRVDGTEKQNPDLESGDSLNSILKAIQTSNAKLLKGGDDGISPSSPIRLRSFPRRNTTFPCYEPEANWRSYNTVQREPARQGFFYVKTFKTASTTVMGVTLRIAFKMAERRNQQQPNTTFKPCKVRFEHWPAYLLKYRQRKRDKSFLFAVLREPTQRAISMFFHFDVSRDHKQPLDANFKQALARKPSSDPLYPDYYPWNWGFDHYLHYLNVEGFRLGSEKDTTHLRIQTVNKILADYDFIGITERLDESLVVLQIILGLKTSDILYYSAKGNGSWDDKGVYIQPSFVSQGMKKFFASDTWRQLSKGDYLMYLAANASLDRTIDSLGRREFEEKLALFRYAKNLVKTNCTDIRPLFSAEGQAWYNDCLLADAGCGNRCFDQLERDFKI